MSFQINAADKDLFYQDVGYAVSNVVVLWYMEDEYSPKFGYYLKYISDVTSAMGIILNADDDSSSAHDAWFDLCFSLTFL